MSIGSCSKSSATRPAFPWALATKSWTRVGSRVGFFSISFLLHVCIQCTTSGRVCHKKGRSTSQKSSFWVRYAVGEQPIRWRKSQLNELILSKPRATQISVTELAKEKPNCLKGSVYPKIGEKDEVEEPI